MFCSTIIPTIGRNLLTRAVESVLSQTLDEDNYEIFVINDSGTSLPNQDWHNSPKVRIINTNRRERSVARNTGAAMARGRYLHFLDDDDWLLPNALKDFRDLSQNQSPAWMYGITQLVDREGTQLIQSSAWLKRELLLASNGRGVDPPTILSDRCKVISRIRRVQPPDYGP
jgi:glycosyltransferase involved in cell wall biosynthesis